MNILLKKASKASKRLFDPGSIVKSPLCTISIHIFAGKIKDCLAFGADPKMSDLDALIGL